MPESPLSKDYIDFFAGLAKTNTKAWFEKHREQYLEAVKGPFEHLVEVLLARAAALDEKPPVSVRDAVFRINRDVRFGRDKSPYKTHMAAVISPAGRKDLQVPGMYVEIGADGIKVVGGLHQLEPPQLLKLRRRIMRHGVDLRRLLKAPAFVRLFGGELHGERNLVLAPEFRDALEQEPLIAQKQFYCEARYPRKAIIRADLTGFLLSHNAALRPVNRWLANALAT